MIHHIIIGALLSINGRPDGQSRFKEIVENQKMYDFYFYSVAFPTMVRKLKLLDVLPVKNARIFSMHAISR